MEAEKAPPLQHTVTVRQLMNDLSACSPDAVVSLAGCLHLMRAKSRGPGLVDLEAAEVVLRDETTGDITVIVP